MKQKRLKSLSLLAIESELVRDLDFSDVVEERSGKRSLHKGATLMCVCVYSCLPSVVNVHCFFMTRKTFVVGMFDIVEILKQVVCYSLKCFCISECRLFLIIHTYKACLSVSVNPVQVQEFPTTTTSTLVH